jgi:diguanylate cyclase (GGDEF)-like protein/PAS domain S-box-containing protein
VKHPLKVLIIEDSEDDAKLALRALRVGGFDPTHRRVQTAADLKTALAQEPWDAVISDFQMPGFTGLEALRIFRSTGLDIPFIIVSGVIGEDVAVDAMRNGADDYLLKDRLSRLGEAMSRAIESKRLRQQGAQAQAALIASELRYRRLFESAKDGILILDAESGLVVDVNPFLVELLGISREAFLGKKIWELGFFGDIVANQASFAKLQQEEYIRYDDKPLAAADGRRIDVEFVSNVYLVNHQSVIQCNIRDVTERKRAAEALQRSQKRLRDLIDGLGPSIFVGLMTPQGILIEANRPALAAAGLKPEDVLGKPFEETYWWAYSREAQQQLREAIARATRGDASRYDVQVRAAENHLIDVDFSLQPVRDETGEVVYLVPSASVITERKQAEKALLKSEAEFRTLAESMPQIVWIAQADGSINYFNKQWMDYTGLTFEESLGHGWNKPFHPDDQQRAWDNWQQTAAAGGNYEVERRLRRADGVYRWWLVRAVPLQDATGNILKWIGTCTDIHDLKVAELEILAANETLRENEMKIRRLNRVYAVLSGINTLIVRVRDRDELFREACRVAVEQGQFKMAWIGVVDRNAMKIVPVASAGAEPEFMTLIEDRFSLREDTPLGNTISARAVREKKAIVSNEIQGDARILFAKDRIARGISSIAILPLLVSDEATGVLALYAAESGFFDEEEMKLLTELAGDIAFALENIGRQQKLDKLARIRAVSSEINAATVRIRERKALLEETCRIVSEHGKFEMTWIGEIDHDAQRVRPIAWTGFSDEAAHAVSWASISTAKGTLGEAIRTRKASVRNDIEGELPGGTLRHEALKQGCRSSVCLPLLVDGAATALVVLFAPGRGFFDKDELALLDEMASDISFALQAIDKQERLDYLAYYDELTGLAKHSLFLERVAQYMRSAVSGGHKLAVGLVDLERFKNINDSLGRPAGDALLKQVAEWLTRRTGDASVLARVGADHFAMVLPEVKQDGNLAGLIDGLMTAFLEHPFRLNDAVFRIALKMGVALFPDDGADVDTLFKNAEAALKKAKAGGDRYLFHTQTMTEAVAGKLTLENQLRQALDKEEFVLHYQPKVDLVSGKLTGAEALIRWNDPRTGLVPPGRFIPILEETGLIYDVGRWALRKAIADYLRWRAAGLAAVRIAVNVSALQLRNRGFTAEIEQVIGVDAHAVAGLELEITESLIMEDVKHNIATLQAIRALGVTIAIDDFGTGFSSLSYLAKLPVDTLKIDRSFVVDMTAGPEGLALVSTIINLAHSLKLKVVAEGVETEEQSRLLRLLKCDEMQGFLFSKPVPGEIFETRFLASASSQVAEIE